MSQGAFENEPVAQRRSGRRWQFSLLTLLVAIAAFGVFLGYHFYFRPLIVTVDARFAVVDRTAANATFLRHASHSIDGSPYAWITLRDDELLDLLQLGGKSVAASQPSHPHTIPYWPQTAFTAISNEPRPVSLAPNFPYTVDETAMLNGFIGSRRAGVENQFRVECNMTCDHPDFKALSLQNPDAHTQIKGKLFYEGAMPIGHVVFLAPLNDDTFSVVIFDVK